MRAALALCCTLGVDFSFLQVLGGPYVPFLNTHSSIHSLIGVELLYTAVSIPAV